jgi:hypothetical protein
MTDQTDTVPPSNGNGANSMTVTEVTGLVQLFNNQLLAMEGRLSAKMDDNSRMASERWVKHDHDSERILGDIEKRFVNLETEFCKQTSLIAEDLKAHVAIADAHWKKEHDAEVALDARLTPVKGLIGYVRSNWKTILLLIVSVLAILGFSATTLENILEHF